MDFFSTLGPRGGGGVDRPLHLSPPLPLDTRLSCGAREAREVRITCSHKSPPRESTKLEVLKIHNESV